MQERKQGVCPIGLRAWPEDGRWQRRPAPPQSLPACPATQLLPVSMLPHISCCLLSLLPSHRETAHFNCTGTSPGTFSLTLQVELNDPLPIFAFTILAFLAQTTICN